MDGSMNLTITSKPRVVEPWDTVNSSSKLHKALYRNDTQSAKNSKKNQITEL